MGGSQGERSADRLTCAPILLAAFVLQITIDAGCVPVTCLARCVTLLLGRNLFQPVSGNRALGRSLETNAY